MPMMKPMRVPEILSGLIPEILSGLRKEFRSDGHDDSGESTAFRGTEAPRGREARFGAGALESDALGSPRIDAREPVQGAGSPCTRRSASLRTRSRPGRGRCGPPTEPGSAAGRGRRRAPTRVGGAGTGPLITPPLGGGVDALSAQAACDPGPGGGRPPARRGGALCRRRRAHRAPRGEGGAGDWSCTWPRPPPARVGPAEQGRAVSAVRDRSRHRGAGAALGRGPAARPTGRLHGREERALRTHRRGAPARASRSRCASRGCPASSRSTTSARSMSRSPTAAGGGCTSSPRGSSGRGGRR